MVLRRFSVPTYPGSSKNLGYFRKQLDSTLKENKSGHVFFLTGFSDSENMDIKGVLKAVLPLDIRSKKSVEKTIQTGSTTDRDANGQMFQEQQQEKEHPPMTEEQLQKALEHLKTLSVVKDHNLTIQLVQVEGKNFVHIQEPSGKIVRRIPEQELWSLQVVKDTEKGQLLRKTA